MAHDHPFLGAQLQPRQGLPAGLLAGLGMLVTYGVLAAVAGPGAERLVNAMASTLLGARALDAGWDAATLAIGLLLHFAVAALLGLLFATSLDRLAAGETVFVSVFFGFTVWVVASFIVAQWFNDAILVFNRTWWGLLSHLVFGCLLGLFAVWRGSPPPTLSPD